ncbi:MAG: MgtC/SapB family protein [Candidatus Gracilibacteria bacterium]|nr:MgtC/SapB family protein [Candidatus Gracilibacteria bacterium]
MDIVTLLLELMTAAVLGAIVGAERDIFNKGDKVVKEKVTFGGIRTFSLVAMLGGVSVLADKLLGGNYTVITSIIIIGAFTLVSYTYSVFKEKQLGMTTEISVFLTYFLGTFVVLGMLKFAVILTIFISFILSLKEFLNKLKEKISREELSNTLKFAVISLVILPLLPDAKYSIFQILQFMGYTGEIGNLPIISIKFFNPYGIWFFVVLMSAISYIGYILSKVIGEKNSIIASGAIGGMISSTAVTASMTERSKTDKKNIDLYVVATLLASAIMFVRVILIVLFFNINMLNAITVPAILMLAGMGVYIYYFYSKSRREKLENKIEVSGDYKSPFTIGPALKFALFVLFIKFISAIGAEYKDVWGNYFYYMLGIISGLADVDAISQTMSVDAKDSKLLSSVATMTIIIAVMSNNIVKGTIAWRFGDKRFGNIVMGGFIISMIFGIIGIILLKTSV